MPRELTSVFWPGCSDSTLSSRVGLHQKTITRDGIFNTRRGAATWRCGRAFLHRRKPPHGGCSSEWPHRRTNHNGPRQRHNAAAPHGSERASRAGRGAVPSAARQRDGRQAGWGAVTMTAPNAPSVSHRRQRAHLPRSPRPPARCSRPAPAAPGATRRARGRRSSAQCRRAAGEREPAAALPPHCSALGGGVPTSPAGPHDPFLLQDEGGAVHQAGHHGHAQAQRHGGGAGVLRRPVPRCRTDRHPHRPADGFTHGDWPGPALPAAVLHRDRPALRAPPAGGGSVLNRARERQQDDVIPSPPLQPPYTHVL